MLLYALALHYVVLGIPGIPYVGFSEHYFWRETTREVERLAAEVEQQTGKKRKKMTSAERKTGRVSSAKPERPCLG